MKSPSSGLRFRLTSQWRPILRTLLAAAVVTALAGVGCRGVASRLTLNLTASMPRGLYWLRPRSPLSRGTAVSLSFPPAVRFLMTTRRYLPSSFHLLKRVVAVAGDYVCTEGNRYVVGDTLISMIATHDHLGRPLEPYRYCGTVPSGYAFVAASGESSLDSRYYGPIALGDLTPAVPLWTSF